MESNGKAAAIVLLTVAFAGSAVAQGKKAVAGTTAEAAVVQVDDKTLRKLSMGIGEEAEDFVVTKTEEVESSAGMKAIVYTVQTRGGQKFKCQIFEQSRFGKIATWGMGAGSSADCTEFSSAGKDSRKGDAAAVGSGPSKGTSKPAAAPVATDEKTMRKISMAIGEEVGDFAVTAQQEIQSSAGMKAMEYTVATDAGKKYKCEIFEQSKFGRVMSWGMASGGSAAVCTDFTKGSRDKGKVNQASCNGLLRAAGKCG
ncbi:hypothetical protein [Lysobacter sp. N42]|uniref:hypothetical protein n=1 Tax=Lysobacter sp. N42 TaxID=2545719 RepID=UPI001053E76A|nr:hypothetical protein [Lysobacter sp. N42]TCZ78987.1 hypothetical protein EYQ95_25465 [Lysobacter sp. N42]